MASHWASEVLYHIHSCSSMARASLQRRGRAWCFCSCTIYYSCIVALTYIFHGLDPIYSYGSSSWPSLGLQWQIFSQQLQKAWVLFVTWPWSCVSFFTCSPWRECSCLAIATPLTCLERPSLGGTLPTFFIRLCSYSEWCAGNGSSLCGTACVHRILGRYFCSFQHLSWGILSWVYSGYVFLVKRITNTVDVYNLYIVAGIFVWLLDSGADWKHLDPGKHEILDPLDLTLI